jgi:hypothetical protein
MPQPTIGGLDEIQCEIPTRHDLPVLCGMLTGFRQLLQCPLWLVLDLVTICCPENQPA